MSTMKVSSTVDEALMDRALEMSGASRAETIRRALSHFITLDAASASAPPPVMPLAPLSFAIAAPLAAERPVTEMTDEEKLRTEEALFVARRGLNKAIMLLQAKASDPSPPPGVDAVEETKRINLEIAELEKQVFDIGQKISALDAETLSMAPPDATIVQSISNLTDSVGRMTADAAQVDQIVAVAKQILGSLGGA